jgi:hypothetical protein
VRCQQWERRVDALPREHSFSPLFVGQERVTDVSSRGRRFRRPEEGEALIPVEFQGAAFRVGHSMVRPSYRADRAGDFGKPFIGIIFDPTQAGQPDPGDLRGGARAPRRFVGWRTFFDAGNGQVKRNKRIDAKISTPLFNLPRVTIPGLGGPRSLAQRDLLRHLFWQLPSGQDIARAIGAPRLCSAALQELLAFGLHVETSTPPRYYVRKEAEIMPRGRHLGSVGGRIVAEVIIGLLGPDRASLPQAERYGTPTLPTATGSGHDFRMTDFLTSAEVDPGHRGP